LTTVTVAGSIDFGSAIRATTSNSFGVSAWMINQKLNKKKPTSNINLICFFSMIFSKESKEKLTKDGNETNLS
tara:strand:- start:96 stop:314 length:219 start_codon:yes stop_codon:yes gene_type:complete